MNRTLLELIKTKLSLIESCKQESFHTMMIYSESLPSLLVQCVGYIENKSQKDRWTLHLDSMNELIKDKQFNKTIQKKEDKLLSDKWEEHLNSNCSETLLNEYKNIAVFSNISNQKEFDIAIDYLLSRKNRYKFVEQTFKELKKYRDEFSHGEINSRRLSIISKQDFYVYFGVLLLVDRCIDSVILHKK